jgi:hypothetical protein
MTVNPFDMLRMLAPGIGPGAGVRSASPAAPARSQQELSRLGFAELLRKASAGELETHAAVSVDASTGLELSDEQRLRLASAADRAEAEGLAMALVQLDGQSLVLDVGARRVTSVVKDGVAVGGIDGVVIAPTAQPATGQPSITADLALPRQSLLKLLDRPDARPGAAA